MQDFEIRDVRVDEGEDVTIESGGRGDCCLGWMRVKHRGGGGVFSEV